MDPFNEDDVSDVLPQQQSGGFGPENPLPVMVHQPRCEDETSGEGCIPNPPESSPLQSPKLMQLDSCNGRMPGFDAHHAMPSSDQSVQVPPHVQSPMQTPAQQMQSLRNSMVSQNEGIMGKPGIPPPPRTMPQPHEKSAQQGMPLNPQHDKQPHTHERPSSSPNVLVGNWQSESDDPHRKNTIQHIYNLLSTEKHGNLESLSKLPGIAVQLEVSLYRDAHSLQDYTDVSTLKQRLQHMAVEVSRQMRDHSDNSYHNRQPLQDQHQPPSSPPQRPDPESLCMRNPHPSVNRMGPNGMIVSSHSPNDGDATLAEENGSTDQPGVAATSSTADPGDDAKKNKKVRSETAPSVPAPSCGAVYSQGWRLLCYEALRRNATIVAPHGTMQRQHVQIFALSLFALHNEPLQEVSGYELPSVWSHERNCETKSCPTVNVFADQYVEASHDDLDAERHARETTNGLNG